VPSATVPEATVHENRETLTTEDKIGLTGQSFVSPPAFDKASAENGCQFQFGVLVAA
jgi:hypothetical protein